MAEKEMNTLGKKILKVVKIISAIICWIIGLYLLYVTIWSFLDGDDWGLAFIFITLPCGVMSFLFLSGAITLTMILKSELLKKK